MTAINLLFSYAHHRDGATIAAVGEAVAPGIEVRYLLDSGAFTAKTLGWEVDRDDLIAWYRAQAHLNPLLIGLDVIGDAPATRANCEAMRDAGLDVIPTVHLGADPRLIADYRAAGWDYLALGGLVNKNVPIAARAKWVRQCQRIADAYEVRLHGLGWTPKSSRTIDTVRRFTTVDSSSYSASTRWGDWPVFAGIRLTSLNGREAAAEIARRHPNARGPILDVLRWSQGRGKGRSHVVYGVAAYAYLEWGEAMGTPIYLALGSGHFRGTISTLNELIGLERI